MYTQKQLSLYNISREPGIDVDGDTLDQSVRNLFVKAIRMERLSDGKDSEALDLFEQAIALQEKMA